MLVCILNKLFINDMEVMIMIINIQTQVPIITVCVHVCLVWKVVVTVVVVVVVVVRAFKGVTGSDKHRSAATNKKMSDL